MSKRKGTARGELREWVAYGISAENTIKELEAENAKLQEELRQYVAAYDRKANDLLKAVNALEEISAFWIGGEEAGSDWPIDIADKALVELKEPKP